VFAYREHNLLLGAAISLLAWGGLVAVIYCYRR
jgi:hypothetical protein